MKLEEMMKLDISRVEADVILYALSYLSQSDLVDRPRHGSFMDGKQTMITELSDYVVNKMHKHNQKQNKLKQTEVK